MDIPNRNSISPVILIAIVAMGFMVGYFYYSSALQGETPIIPPITFAADDNLAKFKDLELDFSAIDDLMFKNLRIFGESPVLPGSTGREDPFAAF